MTCEALAQSVRTPVRMRLIALIASVSALVAACGGGGPAAAQLHAKGSGEVGAAIEAEKPGTPYVFRLRTVCTTAGPIRITSVRPYGASHMHVVAWAVRVRTSHSPWTLSGDKDGVPGTPTDNPGYGHKPVTVRCGTRPSKAVEDFAISVEFTGTRGTMHGVLIGYGTGQVVRSQYAIALCSTRTCARAT